MAAQVEKIRSGSRDDRMDLKELLSGGGKEQTIEQVAADTGIGQTGPFIPGPEQHQAFDRSGNGTASRWARTGNMAEEPLPRLRLPARPQSSEGRRGNALFPLLLLRLSNGGSIGCPVLSAATRSRGPYSIFAAREKRPTVSISAMTVITMSRRSIIRSLEESDPSLEDLATLHLDVVACQKGYTRAVPNPWTPSRRGDRRGEPGDQV